MIGNRSVNSYFLKRTFTKKLKRVTKVILSAVLSFLLAACGAKVDIVHKRTSSNGTVNETAVTIEFPKAPEDGGGNAQTNKDVQEDNNLKASEIFLDFTNSNVVLVPQGPPQITLTLTHNEVPKHTKIFAAQIIGQRVYFLNPTEVDSWAEPFLYATNGIKLDTNVNIERKLGLNTTVVQVYANNQQVAAAAKSEFVTNLRRESDSIGSE